MVRLLGGAKSPCRLQRGVFFSYQSVRLSSQAGCSSASQGIHAGKWDGLGSLGHLWCWGSSSFPLSGRAVPGIRRCTGELFRKQKGKENEILTLHTGLVWLSSKLNNGGMRFQSAGVLFFPWKALKKSYIEINLTRSYARKGFHWNILLLWLDIFLQKIS